MKPVDFRIIPATTLAAASAALAAGARGIAGGQSLMPMLNLRLVRPDSLTPLLPLGALHGVDHDEETVTIGAATTHAFIADGCGPAFADGILPRIAAGIAYRAVRNRGTIGGSLCHADPAADWLTTLTALGAVACTSHPDGGREIPLAAWTIGAFQTVLRPGEILRAIRIPRPPPGCRWAYRKTCRKPGEFSQAMAAVIVDPAGRRRAVIGALGTHPLVLEGADVDPGRLDAMLQAIVPDRVTRNLHCVTLRRAIEETGH